MGTMKFKSGVVTITRTQLQQIAQEAYERGIKEQAERDKQEIMDKAIKELIRREEEVFDAFQDGSLYTVLITGNKALMDMGCDYDFMMEFDHRVADLTTQLNTEELTGDEIEKELRQFGIELIQVNGEDIPESEDQ